MTHKPNPFPYDSWKNQIGNFDYVDEQEKVVKLIEVGAMESLTLVERILQCMSYLKTNPKLNQMSVNICSKYFNHEYR